MNFSTPISQFFPSFRREIIQILQLSGPIFIALFAQTAMGFVDTVMAGKVSPTDLAAVAIGTSIWIPVYLLGGGILLATSPLVSHLQGQKAFAKMGPLIEQALWLSLAIGLLGFLALRSADNIILSLAEEKSLATLTIDYLDGLSFGIPAIASFWVLRGLSEGLSFTKPTMVISFIGLLANIPLNYIFIYGKLGIPAMGGAGCGVATAIVMWLMLICMAIFTLFAKQYKDCNLYQAWQGPNIEQLKQILRLGLPMGFAIFVEVSIFSAVALLITPLGSEIVAGHQIALNYASLVFMIPLSISNAITVRVGQALGADQPHLARLATISGITMTTSAAIVSVTIMICIPESIVALYTDDQVVKTIAISLLSIAALFQLSDSVQVGAIGALRGYKDTKIPMYITIIAYWLIGLPLGYSFALTTFWGMEYGAKGFWWGLVAGLTVAAVLLASRLHSIGWKNNN